jgi:hypothetical protein
VWGPGLAPLAAAAASSGWDPEAWELDEARLAAAGGSCLGDLPWLYLVRRIMPPRAASALAGPLDRLSAAADMVVALQRARVAERVVLGPRYGELGMWALDYAATTLLVRARLVDPPKAFLNVGVHHGLAAAYDGDEAIGRFGGLSSSAAAGRLMVARATVAIVTGNVHWLRPVVMHAVTASEYATPSMKVLADRRLTRY